jgi:hypothetical protein
MHFYVGSVGASQRLSLRYPNNLGWNFNFYNKKEALTHEENYFFPILKTYLKWERFIADILYME